MARLDEIIRSGVKYFRRASDPKNAGPFKVEGQFVAQVALSMYNSPAYFTPADLQADDWVQAGPPIVTSAQEIEDLWKDIFGTIDLVSSDATVIKPYPKELGKLHQFLAKLGGGEDDTDNTPNKGKGSGKGPGGIPGPLRPIG